MPNESALDENLLKGIAIKEEDSTTKKSSSGGSEAYYRYLPLSELSRDAKVMQYSVSACEAERLLLSTDAIQAVV